MALSGAAIIRVTATGSSRTCPQPLRQVRRDEASGCMGMNHRVGRRVLNEGLPRLSDGSQHT